VTRFEGVGVAPYLITTGRDGNLWVADGYQQMIARFTP
jgi:streptogramin lyase